MTAESKFYLFDAPLYSSGVQLNVVRGVSLPDPVIPLGGKGEWDERRIQLFGTVLFDERDRKFRMWYLGMGDEPERESRQGFPGGWFHNSKQGYAESPDGLNWEKPVLAQVEWRGSTANNILSLPYSCQGAPYVLEDPEQGAVPHRYKMIRSTAKGGMLLFSADGVRWHPYRNGESVIVGGRDRGEAGGFDFLHNEVYAFLKDTVTDDPGKRYRAYSQAGSGGLDTIRYIRRISLSCSPDARRWTTHPEPVMGIPGGASGISGQIHGTAIHVFRGYYVAFVHLCLPQPRTGWFAPRVHLSLSRDGEHFRIFENESDALIPLGPEGSWCEGGLVSGSTLTVDDELWCYFSGLPVSACWAGVRGADERPVINTGLARWRRGRILSASVKPGFTAGYLTLDPFTVADDCEVRVAVDADCECPQEGIRISLLDAESRLTIPGFGFPEFTIDSTDSPTLGGTWKPRRRLPAGVRAAPCLQLTGRSTVPYSVQVCWAPHLEGARA